MISEEVAKNSNSNGMETGNEYSGQPGEWKRRNRIDIGHSCQILRVVGL